MFACKTDKPCACCHVEFGFATHNHKIIVSESLEEMEQFAGGRYEIVQITDADLTAETIDLGECFKEQE